MSAATGSPESLTVRTLTVTMLLPDPLLTPNLRLHWGARARHTSAQRSYARWAVPWDLAIEAMFEGVERVRIDVEVRPRPRMKRLDDDNFWSAMKATRDGLADALGFDDKQFVIGTLVWSNLRTSELILTLTAAG